MMPDVRRARRALIVWDRLHGYTLQQLQDKYQLSTKKVMMEMTKARKEGLLQDIESRIIGELSTKALDLYTKALDEGDLFVAKDILLHAAKVADRSAKQQIQKEGMTLQLWMQMRKEQQLNEFKSKEPYIDTTTTKASEFPSGPKELAPINAPLTEEIASQADCETNAKVLGQFVLGKPTHGTSRESTLGIGTSDDDVHKVKKD